MSPTLRCYVGIASEEVDVDFEKAIRSVHIDFKRLSEEAAEFSARIANNFEEFGP